MKSKPGHTPGPWYTVGLAIKHDVGDRSYQLAVVECIGTDADSRSEERQNAWLISAAPDLLLAAMRAYHLLINSEQADTPAVSALHRAILRARGLD